MVGESFTIGRRGTAGEPFVLNEDADGSLISEVTTVANTLGQMLDAEFAVERGNGSSGIVVGVPEEFDALPIQVAFEDDVLSRDEYALKSTPDGVFCPGATPLAATFAAWDLLRQMGYRFFFPSPRWEINPDHESIAVELDVMESSEWYYRCGPRSMPGATQHETFANRWEVWMIRNRINSSFRLESGHSW